MNNRVNPPSLKFYGFMFSQTHLLLLSADTPQNLGKFDIHTLTHQTLMELLIDGITNREAICDQDDDFNDISKWPGVTLNDDGVVIAYSRTISNLKGSLNFQYLPPTVKQVQ